MKKKGFTLIELLAVIVILGVIALITVPVVMNLVEDARRGSFQASLNNLVHTMEINQTKEEDGELSYTFPNDAAKINMKGELSKWNGEAKIDSKGKVDLKIYNGKYCGYLNKGEVQVKTMTEEECLSEVVMDESLVFMFDNNNRGTQNNVWLDSSGNGYNGKISGAVWTNEGLSFDGKDDYVDIVHYDTNTITLELYFRLKAHAPSTDYHVLSYIESGGHSIIIVNNSTVRGDTYLDTSYKGVTSQPLELNTFYHVVYTYDGSVQRLYINGEEVKNQPATGTVKHPVNSIHWALGANPNVDSLYDRFFNGTIHTARLYNRALTAKEVKQNYYATIRNS